MELLLRASGSAPLLDCSDVPLTNLSVLTGIGFGELLLQCFGCGYGGLAIY